MERPGIAVLGSVVVHVGLAGAIAWALFFGRPETPIKVVNAVPVQVISEVEVLGAQPLNPSEELVTEDASTAPVETVPEPTPPEPTPSPPAPTPRPTPTPPRPQPQPPRPQPPRPQQPPRQQPQPPRQQAPRPQPGLNLDDLAGPPRTSPNPGRRPPTGGGSTGNAPRTLGRASLQALGAQIRPRFSCTLPGVQDLEVRVQVRLSESGRLIGRPQLLPPRGGPSYQPVSDALISAIYAAQPFTMPEGYEEQDIPFRFPASQFC